MNFGVIRANQPIAGAGLVSAAGSLPVHLMPALVVTLSQESAIGPFNVGWIGSVILMGQLLAALALPAVGYRGLTVRQAAAAVGLLFAGLVVTIAGGWPVLLAGWFVVGAACGALLFLGATASSFAPDPRSAFALRLACVLWFAGLAMLALQASPGNLSYTSVATTMAASLVVVCASGLYLLAAGPASPSSDASEKRSFHAAKGSMSSRSGLSGLACVFALFVGQPGFWAFSILLGTQRGLPLGGIVWAIAAAKLASGFLLLWSANRPSRPNSASLHLLGAGFMCCISIVIVSIASNVVLFFVAMACWEMSLNLLAARTQAEVVSVNPAINGPWLTAATLLGAASGPPLHGWAIALDSSAIFIAYASLSALFPFLWYALARAKRGSL